MNTKQTAVEYYHDKSTELIHQFIDNKITTRELLTMHHNLFYPAKEMEDNELQEKYNEGHYEGYNSGAAYYPD